MVKRQRKDRKDNNEIGKEKENGRIDFVFVFFDSSFHFHFFFFNFLDLVFFPVDVGFVFSRLLKPTTGQRTKEDEIKNQFGIENTFRPEGVSGSLTK